MNNEPQSRIDWPKSFRNLAFIVWGLATYIGLLAGVIWLSVGDGTSKPITIALTAVGLSTSVNIYVWGAIERRFFSR